MLAVALGPELAMNVTALVTLPPEQLRALADRAPARSGGGSASERDLAVAVALVAMAAAIVLAFSGL
jgi:formiminotetrahydrofolate cyclodeaminase